MENPAWIILITCYLGRSQAHLLYPFGEDEGDSVLPQFYDNYEYVPSLQLNFYGQFFNNRTTIGDNGLVGFGERGEDENGPFPFPWMIPMIALFWDNHYAYHDSLGNRIFHRVTSDPDLLALMSRDIRDSFSCESDFTATSAQIITWYKVMPERDDGFPEAKRRRNTYQVGIVTDGYRTFALLLYLTVEWTENISPGAQVGINHGDRLRSFTLPGAMTPEVQNLPCTSNVGVPGRHVYRVDRAFVKEGACSPQVCICEYGDDRDGDGRDDLVKFDGRVLEFGQTFNKKTLVKREVPTDRCRFKLQAGATGISGVVNLNKVIFRFGIDGGATSTYKKTLTLKRSGVTLEEDGVSVGIDLSVPYEEIGSTDSAPIRLALKNGRIVLQSESCPWELEYRVDGGDKVTFHAGSGCNGPFLGKCGSCQ